MPPDSAQPSYNETAADLLKKNQLSSRSRSQIVWLIFYIVVVLHNILVLKIESMEFIALTLVAFFGIGFSIYQYLRSNQSNYGSDSTWLPTFIFSTIGLVLVAATGNLDSPFIFIIYLIPIIANAKYKFLAPLPLAFIESIVLGGMLIFKIVVQSASFDNPIRDGLLIVSPIVIGYFVDMLVRRFEIQKLGSDQISKSVFDLEEKIKQQVLSFEEIVQGIPSGVITTNSDYSITLANRRALELLKKSWSTIKDHRIYDIWPTKISGGNRIMQSEIELTDLDGQKIIVRIKDYPLLGEASKILGKIYMITDVTHEKELEQMEFDFVTMAAHQLRTPLTSLRGYVSVLVSSALNKINPDEQIYLKRAMFSTDQLLSLVENLINIARIEKGGMKINFTPFDISEVAQIAVDLMSDIAVHKNIKLIFDKPKTEVPRCLGNQYLIGEVIKNLINNAIEYNHTGGTVMLSFQVQPNYLVVHVSDNGKGIPSFALEHLFTKFYRVSDKLNQDSKGTGLGLFISKAIVEAHKGQIWVNTIEGKGSTFSFTIPVSSPALTPQQLISQPLA